jgi:hypothetical protein
LLQPNKFLSCLSEFAAHAQALKEVDSIGESCACGGNIGTEGVEAGIKTLRVRPLLAVIEAVC